LGNSGKQNPRNTSFYLIIKKSKEKLSLFEEYLIIKLSELKNQNKQKALSFPHFPSVMQAFIWRNWGLVTRKKMSQVLNCSEEQLLALAMDMGLQETSEQLCGLWRNRGYISIIRRNWHLLPYEQILELLDWSEEKLAFVLKEEDFLYNKLGKFKPVTKKVKYEKLNKKQIQETQRIKEINEKYFMDEKPAQEEAFDFLHKNYGSRTLTNQQSAFGIKMAYSYSAVYGDPLFDNIDLYPDSLLKQYAKIGVNALWLQSTLYNLVPLGNTNYSKGYKVRLKKLNDIIERAAKYNISIYLYFNEPRNMPEDFFDNHPGWKGAETVNGNFSLCTSNPEVLDALRNATRLLCEEVKNLGGIFTITMSENDTHCRSTHNKLRECSVCAKRNTAEIIAEIHKAIADGIKINPKVQLIAWTWGWEAAWLEKAIELLPRNVKLMCVSETDVETNAQNITGKVLDYSLSKVGPGITAQKAWATAKACNLEIVAKVQLNNSWECSAVPYIPVPQLVKEHIENLKKIGISDLMLSWTLGGYPGGNLELVDNSIEYLAKKEFGYIADFVITAWQEFSDAFRKFPLHSSSQLYFAPQNFGPMNLLFAIPTRYRATMLGFPYDDLERWRGGFFPEYIFEQQFQEMSKGWAKGLEILDSLKQKVEDKYKDNLEELLNISETVYCHFRSTYLQTAFIRLRKSRKTDKLLAILDEEIMLARKLVSIVKKDSRIAFEASNHYYYTVNDLKEKILNCEYLKRYYLQKN
jgi:hypothetical protein